MISTYGRFKVEPQSEKSSDDLLITINVDISSDRVEYTIEDLADIYNNEQKVFLLTYFKKYEIYTSQPYWNAFPRSPQVLELTFNNEEYVIIDNHLKCCYSN